MLINLHSDINCTQSHIYIHTNIQANLFIKFHVNNHISVNVYHDTLRQKSKLHYEYKKYTRPNISTHTSPKHSHMHTYSLKHARMCNKLIFLRSLFDFLLTLISFFRKNLWAVNILKLPLTYYVRSNTVIDCTNCKRLKIGCTWYVEIKSRKSMTFYEIL